MDPFNILYTQDSIDPKFQSDEFVPFQWRGRPLTEAIEEAKLKIAKLKGSALSERERYLTNLHWSKRIKELEHEQLRLCVNNDES